MGLYPTEKLFNGKGNHSQNEKAAYWMWENICKSISEKGFIPKIDKELTQLNLQKSN